MKSIRPPLFVTAMAVAALLFSSARPVVAQVKRLSWKNSAGKDIVASFAGLQDGVVSLRLANGQLSKTALTDLSWESARQAIALKWTPGGLADLRLEVPEKAGASEAFLKITKVPPAEAGSVPKGWTRYRCAHFDFDSQTALDPKTVTGMARVFEATRALLEALPWRIEAVPERGERFRALIYKDLAAYHAGGGPQNSLGVFRGNTGEISLPLAGAESGADTLKHEITHQMMQRLLPAVPWWVAEGTAEYVAMMKYQNGWFDCRTVSKKQVLPFLEARAPYCTDHAFLKALEYRAQTQAEMILDMILDNGSGAGRFLRERHAAEIERLRRRLAEEEERKELFVRMFALPAGQSLEIPASAPVRAPASESASAAPPETPAGRNRRGPRGGGGTDDAGGSGRPPARPGGEDLRELYAASSLMIYYLTMLAPDKGENFARYMWGVQQLRDEYDLSLQFFERNAREYRTKLSGLDAAMTVLRREVDQKAAEYDLYLTHALTHAHARGKYEDTGEGRRRFTHHPDANHPPPEPPKPMEFKAPEIPAPPTPLLTAAEVKKRREQLLNALMEGGQPTDFIAKVKDAATKLGLRLGEKR